MEFYVQQHLPTDPATAPRNFKCQVICNYISCENKSYAIILLEYSGFYVSLWMCLFLIRLEFSLFKILNNYLFVNWQFSSSLSLIVSNMYIMNFRYLTIIFLSHVKSFCT